MKKQAVVLLSMTVMSCSLQSKALKALKAMGIDDVTFSAGSSNTCEEDDAVAFSTTTKTGEKLSGLVCCEEMFSDCRVEVGVSRDETVQP